MKDFKQELKEARKNNDWTKADQLFKELCEVAEIEEISDGDKGESETIAEKRNQQATGQMPGGKKI